MEVCTVVSRANAKNIVALGQWLFSLRSDIFWRLDEYYANGEQGPLRQSLELREDEFSGLLDEIKTSLPNHWQSRQIRFSKKESRLQAPDIMITPQGNFVTTSNYEYQMKGTMTDLVFVELKNRRPWLEYLDCIRTDWNW